MLANQIFVGAVIGFAVEEFFFYTPGRRLSVIGTVIGAILLPVVCFLHG